jgi:hypothetical protein
MFLAVSFAGKFSETLAVSPPGRSRDFLFRPCFTEAETITLPRDGVDGKRRRRIEGRRLGVHLIRTRESELEIQA